MTTAGLELMFTSVQSQLNGPADSVICCLHWAMIKHGFKCTGKGEEPSASAKKSELLPGGWNENQEVYSLLYKDEKDETHLLKVIQMDDSLLVHVLRMRDDLMGQMTVRITDHAGEDLSDFNSALKNPDGLMDKFKKEILEQVQDKKPETTTSRSAQSQHNQPTENDPLRVPSRRDRPNPYPDWGGTSDPFSVGRSDLDPLSGGMGGGMLMDPRGWGVPGNRPGPGMGIPGRLPPGAVPPGARFDPFGPPDTDLGGRPHPRGGGRGAGPDPDHMRPPGYDDMFM